MKTIIYQLAIIMLSLILAMGKSFGQTDTTTKTESTGRHTIEFSNNGIRYTDKEKKKKDDRNFHVKMHFDFGFNNVIDNTNYIAVPADYFYDGRISTGIPSSVSKLSANDLNLITGKSINFNFWPLWFSQDVVKKNVQIETGLGFQFFNYRFDSKVKHSTNFGTRDDFQFPGVRIGHAALFEEITDPAMLQGKAKNKLGVSYISIPLMLRFNTTDRPGKAGLSFAAGVIGSYKLKSWTKFYGEKNAGDYDIKDWMTQVTAEIGIPGIIKFYGTYALQPMYNNVYIDRTPFAIGIRL